MVDKIQPIPIQKQPKLKMGKAKTIALDDPVIQTKLSRAVETGKVVSKREKISSVRELLKTKEIKEAMEDIIMMSGMSPAQKTFLKSLFIEGESKKKAIKKAFGKDLGYQEEIISQGLLSQKGIKEFVAFLKQFYVQVSPIAILKEVDIMLNPLTDPKVALQASMDIQNRAMPGQSGGSQQLPHTLIINMPGSQNMTQVNTQNENQ